ncbi:Drug/metabolite transporter [Cordyceps fumosorosea ARSEF 2679]|uniref:Drug/metabolite transporter n=1 Tax=Cordyceps fumosorosea (strain ARSEF 2679) TaxID=1081104 RepID=A0A167LYE7_CORFA|nr:Drug/metabolite transporter [Cordyceps fumosorosea ARSEF 2679]OAA53682.1 Drug/metabolite transporter [Cordyceps fumosorosea ARSEF 2679]
MSYGSVKTAPDTAAEPATSPAAQADGTSHESPTRSPDAAASPADDQPATFWVRTKHFYHNNIGLFFVFLAQIFASIMAMTTRLLETGFETKFHALQVIFVRMAMTATIGSAYMWLRRVPDFPLGPPGVRGLLVLRGAAGTIGLFGLYYSLSFLDIADSTVITFLVPTLTSFVCWVALREPFTVVEGVAGLIALTGVLFIARPSFLFPHHPDPPSSNSTLHALDGIFKPVPATPAERSFAVALAVGGTFAAATAYATIRVIGTRVHSLVSVNYFAVTATVLSAAVLLLHPTVGFQAPQTLPQWLLLLSIGLSGFLLQVLLTEGLQRERAGRATNMIYTQLVSALVIERVVWGTTPPPESFVGSALIIGAAVWVGLQKKTPGAEKPARVPDEETSLLRAEED